MKKSTKKTILFIIFVLFLNFFGCHKAKDTVTPDVTPPEISNIIATSVTNNQATINWTTDEPSTSQILYGLNSSYTFQTQEDTNKVTSHSMNILNLNSDTQYHFQVKSVDESGNEKLSADNIFMTIAIIGSPIISDVRVTTTIPGMFILYTIKWGTDQLSTSKVYYTKQQGTWTNSTNENMNLVYEHSINLGALESGQHYWFYVYSKNAQGLSTISGVGTFYDSN